MATKLNLDHVSLKIEKKIDGSWYDNDFTLPEVLIIKQNDGSCDDVEVQEEEENNKLSALLSKVLYKNRNDRERDVSINAFSYIVHQVATGAKDLSSDKGETNYIKEQLREADTSIHIFDTFKARTVLHDETTKVTTIFPKATDSEVIRALHIPNTEIIETQRQMQTLANRLKIRNEFEREIQQEFLKHVHDCVKDHMGVYQPWKTDRATLLTKLLSQEKTQGVLKGLSKHDVKNLANGLKVWRENGGESNFFNESRVPGQVNLTESSDNVAANIARDSKIERQMEKSLYILSFSKNLFKPSGVFEFENPSSGFTTNLIAIRNMEEVIADLLGKVIDYKDDFSAGEWDRIKDSGILHTLHDRFTYVYPSSIDTKRMKEWDDKIRGQKLKIRSLTKDDVLGLDAQVGSLEEEESVLDLLVRDRQSFLSGEMGKLTDRATQPIRYMEFYNDKKIKEAFEEGSSALEVGGSYSVEYMNHYDSVIGEYLVSTAHEIDKSLINKNKEAQKLILNHGQELQSTYKDLLIFLKENDFIYKALGDRIEDEDALHKSIQVTSNETAKELITNLSNVYATSKKVIDTLMGRNGNIGNVGNYDYSNMLRGINYSDYESPATDQKSTLDKHIEEMMNSYSVRLMGNLTGNDVEIRRMLGTTDDNEMMDDYILPEIYNGQIVVYDHGNYKYKLATMVDSSPQLNNDNKPLVSGEQTPINPHSYMHGSRITDTSPFLQRQESVVRARRKRQELLWDERYRLVDEVMTPLVDELKSNIKAGVSRTQYSKESFFRELQQVAAKVRVIDREAGTRKHRLIKEGENAGKFVDFHTPLERGAYGRRLVAGYTEGIDGKTRKEINTGKKGNTHEHGVVNIDLRSFDDILFDPETGVEKIAPSVWRELQEYQGKIPQYELNKSGKPIFTKEWKELHAASITTAAKFPKLMEFSELENSGNIDEDIASLLGYSLENKMNSSKRVKFVPIFLPVSRDGVPVTDDPELSENPAYVQLREDEFRSYYTDPTIEMDETKTYYKKFTGNYHAYVANASLVVSEEIEGKTVYSEVVDVRPGYSLGDGQEPIVWFNANQEVHDIIQDKYGHYPEAGVFRLNTSNKPKFGLWYKSGDNAVEHPDHAFLQEVVRRFTGLSHQTAIELREEINYLKDTYNIEFSELQSFMDKINPDGTKEDGGIGLTFNDTINLSEEDSNENDLIKTFKKWALDGENIDELENFMLWMDLGRLREGKVPLGTQVHHIMPVAQSALGDMLDAKGNSVGSVNHMMNFMIMSNYVHYFAHSEMINLSAYIKDDRIGGGVGPNENRQRDIVVDGKKLDHYHAPRVHTQETIEAYSKELDLYRERLSKIHQGDANNKDKDTKGFKVEVEPPILPLNVGDDIRDMSLLSLMEDDDGNWDIMHTPRGDAVKDYAYLLPNGKPRDKYKAREDVYRSIDRIIDEGIEEGVQYEMFYFSDIDEKKRDLRFIKTSEYNGSAEDRMASTTNRGEKFEDIEESAFRFGSVTVNKVGEELEKIVTISMDSLAHGDGEKRSIIMNAKNSRGMKTLKKHTLMSANFTDESRSDYSLIANESSMGLPSGAMVNGNMIMHDYISECIDEVTGLPNAKMNLAATSPHVNMASYR